MGVQSFLAAIIRGTKPKDIVKMFKLGSSGASPVSQLKTKATEKGYLDRHGKATPEGFALVDKFKNDADEAIGL